MTVSINSTLKFKMSAHSRGRRQTNKQTYCTVMAGRPGCLRSEHQPWSRVPHLRVVGPLWSLVHLFRSDEQVSFLFYYLAGDEIMSSLKKKNYWLLAPLSLCCSVGFSLVKKSRGYSSVAVCGLLVAGFSRCRAQALGCAGFRGRGTLWLVGSRAQAQHGSRAGNLVFSVLGWINTLGTGG